MNTSIHTTELDQLLARRGIANIAAAAGWKAEQRGWAYPVFNPITHEVIAHRFKNVDSNAKQKYGWRPNKPNNPLSDWYILPNTRDAIRRASGVCYFANGEPSLLAYHEAGVHNVIATTLSEVSVPSNARDLLMALGVSELRYPADNDDAGRKSATKWRDALLSAKLSYVALSWGDVASKADANDVWIECAFNSELFKQRIAQLDALLLPSAERPMKPIKQAVINSDDVLTNITSALSTHLTGKPAGKNKDGLQCLCPFHEDTTPSAIYYPNSGVIQCWVCGNHSRDDVATRFNITIPQRPAYTAQRPAPSAQRDPVQPQVIPNQTVNVEYVNQAGLSFDGGVICVQSDKGTGKTTWAHDEVIRHRQRDDVKIIGVTPLINLTMAMAERYSLEDYQGLTHVQMMQASSLAVTAKTLAFLQAGELMRKDDYNVLILDELSKTLEQFNSPIYTNDEAWKAQLTLSWMIQRANVVYVTDADLSSAVISWLKQQRDDVIVIENTFKRKLGELILFSDSDSLIDDFVNALGNNKRAGRAVMFVSNSKNQTKKVYEHIKILGYRVLLINSEKSSNKPQREFMRTPDKFINLYDAIILSPSAQTGIDIQTRVFAKFGYFVAQPNTPSAEGCAQLFERARNSDYSAIWIQQANGNAIGDFSELWALESERAKVSDIRLMGLDSNADLDFLPNVKPFYELMVKLKASDNASRNKLDYDLFALLSANYTITSVEGTASEHASAMNDAAAARQAKFDELILIVAPIDNEQYKKYQLAGEISEEVRAGHERWRIESWYKQPISPELYKFDNSSNARVKVLTYESIFITPENRLENDTWNESDYNKPLPARSYSLWRAMTIAKTLAIMLGATLKPNYRPLGNNALGNDLHLLSDGRTLEALLLAMTGEYIEESELASRAMMALATAGDDARLYMGYREEHKDDALLTIKRWLRMIGINFIEHRQRDKSASREYKIDETKLDFLQKLIASRQRDDEQESAENLLQENVIIYS